MHIGVLTGGGDCPGLNAAIRAVTRASLARGWSVTGIHDGWAGVLDRHGTPLTIENTDGFLDVGGTLLGSSRTNPLRTPESYAKAASVFDDMGLDGLVAIGGDDTLSVAGALAGDGLPVVGIAKTIDNDVPGTDMCIGFDTAVETIAGSIARLRTTTMSHHRATVVETMGRQAGWLAAVGGLAGGADYIAVPEQRSERDAFVAHVKRRYEQGRPYSIVVVAEGAEIDGLDVGEAGGAGDGRVWPHCAGRAERWREPGTSHRGSHRNRNTIQRPGSPAAGRNADAVRPSSGHPGRRGGRGLSGQRPAWADGRTSGTAHQARAAG